MSPSVVRWCRMGRTNPTFRDTLSGMEDQWQPYRRGLRRQDQDRFDTLWGYARDHADAGGYLNHPDPAIVMLMSICLGQQRRLDELQDRLTTLEGENTDHQCGEAGVAGGG
jgi:hypothetical protein